MTFNHLVVLAGGVGGARMAHGLAQVVPAQAVHVLVNIGDDFELFGLKICPDLDTVCYTLAGLAAPETGWGRAGETYTVLEAVRALGGPDWFRLGDHDLGTHLARSERLRRGEPLSAITTSFCAAWGIGAQVLPASDDPIPTVVLTRPQPPPAATPEVELAFQDYFVRLRCQPAVSGFRFQGVEHARPAPGVLEALAAAQAIVIAPSNPWVSIDPILAIPGIRPALLACRQNGVPVVAVSPILGGQTVKGPAAKMYAELGIEPSALAVARHYRGLLSGFILDHQDAAQLGALEALGLRVLAADILMRDVADRARLAALVLDFCAGLAARPVLPAGEVS
jgi:LPPG:FO 2-phospho-L-lactate transferase